MAKFNLNAMTVPELVSLRDQINSALSKKIEAERAELQKRMDELSNLHGHAANGPTPPKRRGRPPGVASAKRSPIAGKKVAPKYRGPEGELWTGRGNTPRWLVALEQAGKKRENYLITN
ncbi:MAG TPA: H-NS histone family protein [Bauldia sp.]|nr:H-NS histone family protein [Bauldia sp.]